MIFALEGTTGASSASIIGNVLPAFLLVIGTPLGIWWWVRRGRGTVGTRRLRITDKAALGRNTWIAVAEIDGQRFLLGAGEGGIGLISELEPAPAPEPGVATDAATDTITAMDSIESPRTGLIRRLQHMTLRTPARRPRTFDAPSH